VLKGWADRALLGTYETERAPISRQIADQMMRNTSAARGTNDPAQKSSPVAPAARSPLGRPEFFREHGLVFGAAYESGAVVSDGTAAVHVENPTTDYVPSARPGGRAPHVWLERRGERVSTLDLFGLDMVVLSGPEGEPWRDAARAIGA